MQNVYECMQAHQIQCPFPSPSTCKQMHLVYNCHKNTVKSCCRLRYEHITFVSLVVNKLIFMKSVFKRYKSHVILPEELFKPYGQETLNDATALFTIVEGTHRTVGFLWKRSNAPQKNGWWTIFPPLFLTARRNAIPYCQREVVN